MTKTKSMVADCPRCSPHITVRSSKAAKMPRRPFQELVLRLFTSQIAIRSSQPVGAGWMEDVEVHGIFESFGLVCHVWWNGEHFAGAYDDLTPINPKLKRSLQNVGQLFIDVTVLGNDAALLQQHPGQHDVVSDDHLPLQQRV